jgi:Na+/H+ antiporter NhaB
MTFLSYLASACIIGAYVWSVRNPKRAFFFHLANALGGIPLLVTEYLTGAYAVMPMTAAFTLVGWWGISKDWFSIDWSGPMTVEKR